MIVLVYGGDELGIRRRLDALREEADGGTGMIESNVTGLDGRDAKPQEIINACMAAPFLSAKRLVIVEHLFERFESFRSERNLPKNIEALVKALEAGIPEWTILVLLGAPFGRETTALTISPGNTLVRRLQKVPGVTDVHLPSLAGNALLDYIGREANRRGIRFRQGKPADRLRPGERLPEESDPARLIAALCQSDTLSIANELDKLALYADGGEITVVEVNRVCAGERVATGFNLRDAVLDGNLAFACECRDRLLRDGAEYGGLFYNLGDAYRSVARLVDAVEDGATAEEIGRMMGAAGRYPNLRDAMIRRVRAISSAGVKRAFQVLVEADRSIKLGEADEDVAFDLALARLCEIARPQMAPRRR